MSDQVQGGEGGGEGERGRSVATTWLIADTNIFRYLAHGQLKKSDICDPGEILCSTSITAMELADRIDRCFEARRDAAKAMVELADKGLPDPDSFQAQALGMELADPCDYWGEVTRLIAEAPSLQQLTSGGIRRSNGSWCTLDAQEVARVRKSEQDEFCRFLCDLLAGESPQASAWLETRKGHAPKLKGEDRRKLEQLLNSPKWWMAGFECWWNRACSKAKAPPSQLPQDGGRLIQACCCALAVYKRYLLNLFTAGWAPQENDYGDLRLFDYSISPHHIILTAEGRWHGMACEAGCAERVRLVKLPRGRMPVP